MKRNILIQVLAFSLMMAFSFSTAQAQTPQCSSAASAVAGMWNSYGVWSPSVTVQAYGTLATDAIRKWNRLAGNSWGSIGPRHLSLKNKSATGTILGQTNRTFVTVPSHGNTVKIILRKTDGRAKTGVTICTQTKSGTRRTVKSYTFNNSKAAMTKTFIIPNAKGKVISVNMRNYSVGNKFKYTIRATK